MSLLTTRQISVTTVICKQKHEHSRHLFYHVIFYHKPLRTSKAKGKTQFKSEIIVVDPFFVSLKML